MIWNHLRHLGLIKVKDADRYLAHSVEELNGYFVSAGNPCGDAPSENFDLSGGDEFDDSEFYWTYITPASIRRVISGIKTNATGNDGISLKILCLILPYILPVLENIFNYSLSHGVFPEVWKRAIVCPMPKVRAPTALQHYRPISILPVMSKILERIVCNQIKSYLEENNLFDPCQFAYREGHSTQTGIIRVLDEIRLAADKRKITVSVLFDLSKAFDRVDHSILLNKLKSKKFSNLALRWINSYLNNRLQATRDPVDRSMSSFVSVDVGVPQGSVLGPLLFVLYISDFQEVLSYCSYSFYADDLMVYLHCEPRALRDGIAYVNSDVCRIVTWASTNKLILNCEKTQAIIMGSSRHVNAIDINTLPSIKVSGVDVPYMAQVKYLGVVIASSLSWNEHITNVTKKIWRTLYQLKLCRNLMPLTLKKNLVISLIFPYIDYCCCAFTDMTAANNMRLYRTINACIRFIYNVRRDEHITPYYNALGWLKTDSRRIYFVGCLIYSILLTECPKVLYNNFCFRSATSNRLTRAASDLLVIPLCRTEIYRRSFICTATALWNGMPAHIRGADSMDVFKSQLHAYLLKEQINNRRFIIGGH